jgi:uncharacterized protein YlxW (UPF0749 family)
LNQSLTYRDVTDEEEQHTSVMMERRARARRQRAEMREEQENLKRLEEEVEEHENLAAVKRKQIEEITANIGKRGKLGE